MKSKKAQIEKKPAKKSELRVARKELETSIADKFLDVIRSFGDEAGSFTKEVKKFSKSVAKKLAAKVATLKDGSGRSKKAIKKQSDISEAGTKKVVKIPEKTKAKGSRGSAKVKHTAPATNETAPVGRGNTQTKPVSKSPARGVTKKPPAKTPEAKDAASQAATTRRGRPSGVASVTPTVKKPRSKRVASGNEAAPDKKISRTRAASPGRTNNRDIL